MSVAVSLSRSIIIAGLFVCAVSAAAFGQEGSKRNHELWFYSYNYFKINKSTTFNQDLSYQQSLGEPFVQRFMLRSQINYSISSVLSLHGGLSLYQEFNKNEPNGQEVRPWQGIKLRWPVFWRVEFSHYVRLEERLEHLQDEKLWSPSVRARYKLSASLPINKAAITDHTLYLILGYEYLANAFNHEFARQPTDYHRFDLGSGFRFNKKSRAEAILINIDDFDTIRNRYTFNALALQLKYYHYFNF